MPVLISPADPVVLANSFAKPHKLFVDNVYPFLPHHAARIPATIGDENDVPSNDRFMVVTPDIYYKLANVDKLVSRDFSANNGDFGKGSVVAIGGVPVIKSNTAVDAYVNSATDSATGQNNDYLVNASDVVATIFQRGAIGSVKRKDLTLESTYDARRLGTLLTARMMIGSNILRPKCAVSINKS